MGQWGVSLPLAYNIGLLDPRLVKKVIVQMQKFELMTRRLKVCSEVISEKRSREMPLLCTPSYYVVVSDTTTVDS